MPSAASVAANTPLRAANGVATLFHDVSSPDRVTRKGTDAVALIPMALAVCSRVNPNRLQTPAVVDTDVRLEDLEPDIFGKYKM